MFTRVHVATQPISITFKDKKYHSWTGVRIPVWLLRYVNVGFWISLDQLTSEIRPQQPRNVFAGVASEALIEKHAPV